MDTVLVTGGAGFIGSHACKALSASNYRPVALDNLSTGHRSSVRWGPLVECDLSDQKRVHEVIADVAPIAVMHFAASAYVGESVTDPQKYYRNNVVGTLNLLDACVAGGVNTFVFSSSCATYGIPDVLPIGESTAQLPINPYGHTKLICEMSLKDYASANKLTYAALRYFNACGADPDGELREDHDPETHLIPRALMAARGEIPSLSVFGDDYDTPDGTCIRDYIHVTDLALAHVAALERLLTHQQSFAVNLGTGRGYSVLEILSAIEAHTGAKVPVTYEPRRHGDPPVLFADNRLAKQILNFTPSYSDLASIVSTAAGCPNSRAVKKQKAFADA